MIANFRSKKRSIAPLVLLTILLAVAANSAQADEPAGTLGVDPVELIKGKEVVGREDLSAQHYRFRYLFVSEQNRKEFLAHPEKYEIQLGGACGRMGALSGQGNAELFAEHDGRIYIFASPTCRETFLKDPFRFLDQADPMPPDDPVARRKGLEWIERAVAAMGGAGAVDGAKSCQWRKERKEESGGVTYDVSESVVLVFPDRLRTHDSWNEYQYTNVVDGQHAWYSDREKSYSLHAQQRDALLKTYMARNLLSILKARHRPGFVAHHEKAETVDYDGTKITVEYITAAFDGYSCLLGLDAGTGKIVSQAYRAQGPRSAFGVLEHTYMDYRDNGGVLYPARQSSRFEGRELPDHSTWTIAVNGAVDAGLFVRPAGAKP